MAVVTDVRLDGWDRLATHELQTRLGQHLEAMRPPRRRRLFGDAAPPDIAFVISRKRHTRWGRWATLIVLGDPT